MLILSSLAALGWTGPSTGIAMVKLPAAEHTLRPPMHWKMDKPEDYPEVYRIPKGVWVATHELTQRDYERAMGTPAPVTGPPQIVPTKTTPTMKGDTLPVHSLSLLQTLELLNRLSELDGLTPAYRFSRESFEAATALEEQQKDDLSWSAISKLVEAQSRATDSVDLVVGATGYRLPTPYEWEHFAAAGTTVGGLEQGGLCKSGNTLDQSTKIFTIGYLNAERSTCDDGYAGLAPVGSYPPNKWGLYDVFGNMAEATFGHWSWSVGSPRYVPKLDSMDLQVRGGDFAHDPRYSRLHNAETPAFPPSSWSGIRVVRGPLGEKCDTCRPTPHAIDASPTVPSRKKKGSKKGR